MTGPNFTPMNIDTIIDNSYRNFHAKGFDYICIHRSPEITQKLYFFDGDASNLSEVVNPHDHRYDFETWCLSGEVENVVYGPPMGVGLGEQTYQTFSYMTPLNGGDGFTWAGETPLAVHERNSYTAGRNYKMIADQIHTIRMVRASTILLLNQFQDVVPIDQPTRTYSLSGEAPILDDGLYEKFTRDEVVAKFALVSELVPGFPVPLWQ